MFAPRPAAVTSPVRISVTTTPGCPPPLTTTRFSNSCCGARGRSEVRAGAAVPVAFVVSRGCGTVGRVVYTNLFLFKVTLYAPCALVYRDWNGSRRSKHISCALVYRDWNGSRRSKHISCALVYRDWNGGRRSKHISCALVYRDWNGSRRSKHISCALVYRDWNGSRRSKHISHSHCSRVETTRKHRLTVDPPHSSDPVQGSPPTAVSHPRRTRQAGGPNPRTPQPRTARGSARCAHK